MVSEFLKYGRSLEELDELFKHDKHLAAIAASVLFQHEINAAVSSVSEIQNIAQSRILADSQVASANLMTHAEVRAAHLLAQAQQAKMKAILREYDSSHFNKNSIEDEIKCIQTDTTEALSLTAKQAIQEIQESSQRAIKELREKAEKAIEEIMTLSKDVQETVEKNLNLAKKKLAEQKQHTRTSEEVEQNAQDASQLVVVHALKASQDLKIITEGAIRELRTITDDAIETLQTSTNAATVKLSAMLAKALALLDEDIDLTT